MAAATESFRDLMKKHSRFEWKSKREKVFELMKQTVGEFCKITILMSGRKRELNATLPSEASGLPSKNFIQMDGSLFLTRPVF